MKVQKQAFVPNSELASLMEIFRQMVNTCIRIGLGTGESGPKGLCKLCYPALKGYGMITYYKLCAISHAAGILANRKKSIKRGLRPRHPYASRPLLISCYGFKVIDGTLKVPLGNKRYFDIQLNSYVKGILSDSTLRIRSFTITPDAVCVCYSKTVERIESSRLQGVDRNLRNLTIGDFHEVRQYDLSKAVDIADNTLSVVSSFKRNDVRIRKKIYGKYGRRRQNRINQLLHHVSKRVVQQAKNDKTTLAFEDIRHLRRLYRRGNFQGRTFRARLNAWSFAEIKRQIEYKAIWEGLPILQLSKKETKGTSKLCPRCGKRITQEDRSTRQLWCSQCRKWMDRDVFAAMNLSVKGLARFASPQGAAGEAMMRNPESVKPVILRVDAAKLSLLFRDTS